MKTFILSVVGAIGVCQAYGLAVWLCLVIQERYIIFGTVPQCGVQCGAGGETLVNVAV